MRALRAVAERWARAGRRADALLGAAGAVGYGLLAQFLFQGRAGNIDEVVTRWQATLLLDGRLAAPLPAHPEAVLTRFTGIGPAGLIGQFPIGTVMAMAPFEAIGLHWLMGAAWGGLGLYCWARLVRRLEPHAPTALAAVLLLAISPFYAAQSATQLGHVPLLAMLLLAGLLLARLTEGTRPTRHAMLLGLAVGSAATIRPLDALTAAVPTAAAVLWLVARNRLTVRVIPAGLVGVALPVALLLGSNAVQTGAPHRFGYEQVWGPAHRLGFHEAPYGEPHTPARGLVIVQGYLRDLGRWAWGAPLPALVPVGIALLLGGLAAGLLDLWLLLSGAALLVGYWAYWHDGAWLGPRFVLPLMPVVALWTARLPRLVARWRPRLAPVVAVALAVNVAWGVAIGAPPWFRTFRNLDKSVAADFTAVLAGAPATGLVLVHDDLRRSNAARLRVVGASSPAEARAVLRESWCNVGWRVRWLEAGEAPPAPPVPAAWQAWCTATGSMQSVAGGRDASGAILIGSTPTRPVIRDLGARTLLVADTLTLRERTMLLSWGGPGGGTPRIDRLDYDSARASWAAETAAFAAARREVTP